MITKKDFLKIHRLNKQGKSIRQISSITGLDRRTYL